MMGLLGPLMRVAGLAVLKSEAQAAARRASRKMAFGAAFGIALLLALSFALAAFTVWLAGEIGAIAALAAVAASFLVIAVTVRIVASMTEPPRRRRAPAYEPPRAAQAEAAPLAGAGTGEPPAGSELGSMAVVAIVGFILARQLWRK